MSRVSQSKTVVKKKRDVTPKCPKCGHSDAIKSGYVQNEQRWKCKECDCQYTRSTPRGRPLWQKSLVVFLYCNGLSMRAIGEIFHIQPSTVLKWVRHYAEEMPGREENGVVSVMALKEMQQHINKISKKKSATLWIAISDTTFKENLGITIGKD